MSQVYPQDDKPHDVQYGVQSTVLEQPDHQLVVVFHSVRQTGDLDLHPEVHHVQSDTQQDHGTGKPHVTRCPGRSGTVIGLLVTDGTRCGILHGQEQPVNDVNDESQSQHRLQPVLDERKRHEMRHGIVALFTAQHEKVQREVQQHKNDKKCSRDGHKHLTTQRRGIETFFAHD